MTTLEELKKEKLNSETGYMSGPKETTLPSSAKYYLSAEDAVATPEREAYRSPRPSVYRYDEYGEYFVENDDIRSELNTGNADALPSRATLKMLNSGKKAPAQPFDDTDKVKFKINTKGKFMLVVYAVAVLALILVIVFNAVSVERARVASAAYEAEIVAYEQTLTELEQQYTEESSPAAMKDKAEELGFVE